MRSIWKGAISFGLVNIPVRMYAATQSNSISFNQLHNECFTPINYVRRCPNCEREVSQAEIVRGFPTSPGQFVVVSDQELDNMPIPTAHSIEIMDFINLAEIDPVFYEKSYYLEPIESALKPYALLRRAMLDSGKVAIAKVAMRAKESLCAVRVYRQALSLATMHYPDEVRQVDELASIKAEPPVSEAELRMAGQLIESLSAPFTPEKYTDAYRQALMQLITEKASGRQVQTTPAAPAGAAVADLMAALEASLQAAQQSRQSQHVGDGHSQSATSPVLVGAGSRNDRN